MIRHARAALLAVLALLPACSNCSSGDSKRTKQVASTLAGGLVAALEATEREPAPHLCATWPGPADPNQFRNLELEGGAKVELRGNRLELSGFPAPLKIAAVADARGNSDIVRERLAGLAEIWRREGVAAVFVLGGMAESKDDLTALLEVAASGRRWVVVALPGDRESYPALRGAVHDLASAGWPVFDGSRVRLVDAGDLEAVTVPGMAHADQLVSGSEGCVHKPKDAEAAARALSRHEGPRLWISYAAPRQRGPVASDLADGVHAGEPELAAAFELAHPTLAMHGQIELPIHPHMTGSASDRHPAALAVGALELSPPLFGLGASAAGVIVTARGKTLRWRRTHSVGR